MRTLKNLFFVVFFLSIFVSSAYAGGGSCSCNIPQTTISQGVNDQTTVYISTPVHVYWVVNLMTVYDLNSYAGASGSIGSPIGVSYNDNSGDGITRSYPGNQIVCPTCLTGVTLSCSAFFMGAGGRGEAHSYVSISW